MKTALFRVQRKVQQPVKNSYLKGKSSTYERIPMTRRVLADLDTPLSIYTKLALGKNSFLLESVEGGEKWGRYSIIGLPSPRHLTVEGFDITLWNNGESVERHVCEDPLSFIEGYRSQFSPPTGNLPRFCGGLVGYFGYDTMRYVEPKLANTSPPDPLNLPDIYLLQVDHFIVFDSLKGEILIVKYIEKGNQSSSKSAVKELDDLEALLNQATPTRRQSNNRPIEEDIEPKPEFNKKDFLVAVEKVKKYIVDGDVMQVVLAQRMSTPIKVDPLDIYRALRHLNPSPYLYYFDFEDFQIVGSSPEILIRVENDTVTTRPLAGTRPRGENEEDDLRLEKELLADPKELAEHLMLIDLGRNDIGRIAKTGSVKVTQKMTIERYSHVMHISSTVEGTLKPDKTSIDVLKATLPVGTLSGAPKIRALEIIDELEPVRRGIYGGAIGYLSWRGDMDTAIAIRTGVIKDNRLYVQAGCGIVADSIPEMEWEETINKGQAVFKALSLACKNLKLDN
jgi:anthranilate synthase component I